MDTPDARPHDVESLRRLIVEKLTYAAGRDPLIASDRDWFVAAALALRDRIVDRWLSSTRSDNAAHRKRVYYLSLEFLPGRMLLDSLNNAGLTEPMRLALAELGVDLERLRAVEPDPALGNGGLGRLAACFMESMASLGIPAHGFGIRYNHGLFQQVIRDGWQHEYPENWLSFGNPWEFERPDISLQDRLWRFGGRPAVHRQHVAVGLASGRDGDRHRLRHAGHRLARPAREHAAPVVGAGTGPSGTGDVQPRRSCRRAGRTVARQCHIADPLPQRRNAGGPGIAAAAGVFLLVGFVAGPAASPHPPVWRPAQPRRQVRHPAQRHASRDRRRGTDAAAGGRARPEMGRGLADHHRHDLLHQPHAAARGAGKLAGAADGAAAAAPHADHLRDQQAASRRAGQPAGHAAAVRGVADRRARRTARAHGHPRLRRFAQGERRVRAAHRADAPHRVPVAAPALSRPHRQQDQRHHLPPLAVHRQSRSDRFAVRCDRTGGHGRSDGARAACADGGRCGAARAADRREAQPTRWRWPRWSPSGWISGSTRTR